MVGYVRYELGQRIYSVSWGAGVGCINYYNDRMYERRSMTDEEYDLLFQGNNWDSLNLDEQSVFLGDELYLVFY